MLAKQSAYYSWIICKLYNFFLEFYDLFTIFYFCSLVGLRSPIWIQYVILNYSWIISEFFPESRNFNPLNLSQIINLSILIRFVNYSNLRCWRINLCIIRELFANFTNFSSILRFIRNFFTFALLWD